MQIRLLKSIKDEAGWHKPGGVLEVTEEEAKFLFKKKAAISVNSEEVEAEEKFDNVDADDEEIVASLLLIDGVDESIAQSLIEAGYNTLQKVADAKQPQLVKIKGIGGKKAVTIIESAQYLLQEDVEEDVEE